MPDYVNIAIVDDDLAMREALQDLLRSCGYKTTAFASAEGFLASGDIASVDCMVLDVRMSGMTGIELQEELKARGAFLPIIFMTSYFDDRTRRAALDGGAVAFLGKPVDDETLLDSLSIAVGGRKP